MREFIGFNIAMFGAKIWEKNGYYIDKENNVVQENYNELTLLGKIGYNLFIIDDTNPHESIRSIPRSSRNLIRLLNS